MSLTEFVGEPAVRDRIDETFPNDGERPTSDLQASCQTDQYALVRTAFDYLLRFWMRRHAGESTVRPWVSETALEVTKQEFPDRVDEVHPEKELFPDEGTHTSLEDVLLITDF